MKSILKSIFAVFAGFLTVVILSILTDAILEKIGIFPNQQNGLFITWMLVLALIYRTGYAILGGYVTAVLAPSSPNKHVIVLAILGTIAGIVGVFAGWNLSQHWYPIALAVLAFPSVYLGGKLKK